MTTDEATRPASPPTTYRPATPDDLPACAAIWRTALNDYMLPLNMPEIPDDLGPILRLYRHLLSTDPDTFVVAERAEPAEPDGPTRIVGFVSAVRRGELWFLSMLFILPEAQAAGLGRSLLERVLPAPGTAWLATCTDSAQPVSNALYASLGMVPRLPLLRLVGLPERPAELPPLPAGIGVLRFDEVGAAGERLAGAALDDELAAIDREIAGFEHRQDQTLLQAEDRIGFLFIGPDGASVGYGYSSETGRVGPVAVRDRALLGPVIGHLVTAVRPRGAFGLWLPGAADVLPDLLRAGFRIEGFPCLICWDRPLTDFSRYVPISPGLL
jgi:ribosomal protein S18 acetylase RimI-like enzyme